MILLSDRRSQITIGLSVVLTLIIRASLVTAAKMNENTIPEFSQKCVRIQDIAKVNSLVKEFIGRGKEGLQVVADFDRTITKYKHDGKLVPTCHNVINDNKLMSETFRTTARDLYLKYYPIEVDQTLKPEQKIPHMIEWWTQAHELIMSSRLTQSSLACMINEAEIKLRDGTSAMFTSLRDHHVPLLIFSAGVGDVIDGVLRQRGELYDNMKIVSNFMKFDDQGQVSGFKGDIIHIYNKNEGAIHESDYFKELVARKNVLLVGDSIGDLSMARGVEGGNILKIGFLNDNIEERLSTYMNLYDIVLVEDETWDIPNAILREVLQ